MAQVSVTHCTVFGEHWLPVRSEVAVEEASSVARLSRRRC